MLCLTIGKEAFMVEKGSCIKEHLKKIGFMMPCGGNGLCGKCKIRANGAVSPITEQEKAMLTSAEIRDGVRLACFTYVEGDCSVSIPKETMHCAAIAEGVAVDGLEAPSWNYAIAVDIGTTTVAMVLIDGYGNILAKTTVANPQAAWGADVLTRAQAAAAGEGEKLTASIRACINEQIAALCQSAEMQTEQIDAMAVAGNTVMLCLYAGVPVDGLIRAPFRSASLFGLTQTASQCAVRGVRGDVPVYFPPCLDAFLGADFTCAMGAVGLLAHNQTALLLDIGTNGEMGLWHNGILCVCSTAAGPAFEGVGISCGMPAVGGAIEGVDVINQRLEYRVIGGGDIRGVCGSGLIDLLACLKQVQEVDENGCLLTQPYYVSHQVQLTQEDAQNLMVSKSAIRSGIDTLLHHAGITPSEVETVYLAGGFGSTLHIPSAVAIGLIPREMSAKIRFVGNAALEGARRFLFEGNVTAFPPIRKMDLATDAYFADAFIRHMKLD